MGCRRIGQHVTGSTRPLIFGAKSTDIIYQFLKKAKRLKDVDGFQTIYISPNRALDE